MKTNEDRIKRIMELTSSHFGDVISDVWGIEDIINVFDLKEMELSDEDAILVLKEMQACYDPKIGYNFSQVDIAFNNLVKRGEINDNNYTK